MLMGTAMPMCTSIFRAIPLRCHGLRTSVFVRTPRESLFLHMYIYIQVYMHALFLYVILLFIHIYMYTCTRCIGRQVLIQLHVSVYITLRCFTAIIAGTVVSHVYVYVYMYVFRYTCTCSYDAQVTHGNLHKRRTHMNVHLPSNQGTELCPAVAYSYIQMTK